jgi:hypothetical protein
MIIRLNSFPIYPNTFPKWYVLLIKKYELGYNKTRIPSNLPVLLEKHLYSNLNFFSNNNPLQITSLLFSKTFSRVRKLKTLILVDVFHGIIKKVFFIRRVYKSIISFINTWFLNSIEKEIFLILNLISNLKQISNNIHILNRIKQLRNILFNSIIQYKRFILFYRVYLNKLYKKNFERLRLILDRFYNIQFFGDSKLRKNKIIYYLSKKILFFFKKISSDSSFILNRSFWKRIFHSFYTNKYYNSYSLNSIMNNDKTRPLLSKLRLPNKKVLRRDGHFSIRNKKYNYNVKMLNKGLTRTNMNYINVRKDKSVIYMFKYLIESFYKINYNTFISLLSKYRGYYNNWYTLFNILENRLDYILKILDLSHFKYNICLNGNSTSNLDNYILLPGDIISINNIKLNILSKNFYYIYLFLKQLNNNKRSLFSFYVSFINYFLNSDLLSLVRNSNQSYSYIFNNYLVNLYSLSNVLLPLNFISNKTTNSISLNNNFNFFLNSNLVSYKLFITNFYKLNTYNVGSDVFHLNQILVNFSNNINSNFILSNFMNKNMRNSNFISNNDLYVYPYFKKINSKNVLMYSFYLEHLPWNNPIDFSNIRTLKFIKRKLNNITLYNSLINRNINNNKSNINYIFNYLFFVLNSNWFSDNKLINNNYILNSNTLYEDLLKFIDIINNYKNIHHGIELRNEYLEKLKTRGEIDSRMFYFYKQSTFPLTNQYLKSLSILSSSFIRRFNSIIKKFNFKKTWYTPRVFTFKQINVNKINLLYNYISSSYNINLFSISNIQINNDDSLYLNNVSDSLMDIYQYCNNIINSRKYIFKIRKKRKLKKIKPKFNNLILSSKFELLNKIIFILKPNDKYFSINVHNNVYNMILIKNIEFDMKFNIINLIKKTNILNLTDIESLLNLSFNNTNSSLKGKLYNFNVRRFRSHKK